MCSKEVEVGKALYANLEAPSCALLKVRMDLQTVKFESKRIEPRRHEEKRRKVTGDGIILDPGNGVWRVSPMYCRGSIVFRPDV